MIKPPEWTESELDQGRLTSIASFRRERLQEPLEAFLDHFDDYQEVVEELLELTVDLLDL